MIYKFKQINTMKQGIQEIIENDIFTKLLEELKTEPGTSSLAINLSAPINKNIDIYLYDWKRGLIKISGYAGGRIGSAIRSAITRDPEPLYRTETDSFSNIYIHDKLANTLHCYRFGILDI
jgi:hypothetical protein